MRKWLLGLAFTAYLSSSNGLLYAQQAKEVVNPYYLYDPEVGLLQQKLNKTNNPHTTLKDGEAHLTRDSLYYAIQLLESGRPAQVERAARIIQQVLLLQEQNPLSKSYGSWPYYLEEPLSGMTTPDMNWADFCGAALLDIAINYEKALPKELLQAIDNAILHAAFSIKHRNVGPAYTNISILGSYVTLAAGERYGVDELRSYAMDRWQAFYEYTMKAGTFAEYNSPTYSVVSLRGLGLILRDIRNPAAGQMAKELIRLLWEEIAAHTHVPTGQWAGPHSRSYSPFVGSVEKKIFEEATSGNVLLGVGAYNLPAKFIKLEVPKDLVASFQLPGKVKQVRTTYMNGRLPLVGTSYMTPLFALGTINHGDFWEQRNNLIVYWGSKQMPSYFRMRVLINRKDFSAAQFFSQQERDSVLGAVALSTDGGLFHPTLDSLKDGRVKVGDLRIRFEAGGAAKFANFFWAEGLVGNELVMVESGTSIRLAFPVLKFDFGQQPHWEFGRNSQNSWADLVVYSGEERIVSLGEIPEAILGFAMKVRAEGDVTPLDVRWTSNGVRARLDFDGLILELPMHPASIARLRQHAVLKVGEGL